MKEAHQQSSAQVKHIKILCTMAWTNSGRVARFSPCHPAFDPGNGLDRLDEHPCNAIYQHLQEFASG